MKTCCHCQFLKVISSLFFQRFNLWDSASKDILRGLDGGRNKRHLPYRHGGNQQSAGKCSQPSTVHVPGNNSSKRLLWKPALLKEQIGGRELPCGKRSCFSGMQKCKVVRAMRRSLKIPLEQKHRYFYRIWNKQLAKAIQAIQLTKKILSVNTHVQTLI